MLASTVIVTMAGRGSRFRAAGYTVPKYRVEVRERSLFAWSLESLKRFAWVGSQFIFVHLQEDDPRDFIAHECSALCIRKWDFVGLEEVTDGQATTALAAAPVVGDPAIPVVIYNIDTYVESQYLRPASARGTGWIPCFPGEGSQWSFARTDSGNRVLEVREKQRISPHATVGLYWFQSFRRYADAYDKYYSRPGRLERGERYIAPLYNQLIADGGVVYMEPVPSCGVHPLGTPEEVEAFRNETETGGPDSDFQRGETAPGFHPVVQRGGVKSA